MNPPHTKESAALHVPVQNDGETEQRLRVAAYKLFLRHGYHGVELAEIAQAVGLSTEALRRHFPRKESFLDAAPNGSTLVVSNFAGQPDHLSPKRALYNAVTETIAGFDVGYGHSDLLDVWRKVVSGAPRSVQQGVVINALAKEALTVELARRLAVNRHESLEPAVLVGICTGATYVVFEHWLTTASQTPLAELCGHALQLAGFTRD